MNRTKAEATVERLVHLLVTQDYERVETVTSGQRLSAQEIEAAVHSVNETLVPLSKSQLQSIEFDEVTGSAPQKWWAAVDLASTVGRSDLTMEIQLTDREVGDFYPVEVEDLRVM